MPLDFGDSKEDKEKEMLQKNPFLMKVTWKTLIK